MPFIDLIRIISIVFLLIFSFIFSGSEVALLSISEHEKLKFLKKKTRKNQLLLHYLHFPQKALITILVGNMVVNVSAAIIGQSLSDNLFLSNSLFYSVFIMTFLVLLFGEIVPKNLGATKPLSFSHAFINVINLTNRIFSPLVFLISGMVKKGSKHRKKSELSREEIITAIESGSSAVLDDTSVNLLKNMVNLIEKPVIDIMVPRSSIQGMDINDYWSNMEKFIKKTTFSTVLFYKNSIDNILGYLEMTDCINLRKKDIWKKLRRPLYIPESKQILSLLSDFKETNNYLAIVLDEYGGTSGLITIKDVLDSIFLKDVIIKKYIQKKEVNRWIVHGNTRIADLNSVLELNLTTDLNTVSGYIVNMSGVVPEPGAELKIIPNYRIRVLKSNNKQIEMVEFRKVDS